jgi:hypothetical protein
MENDLVPPGLTYLADNILTRQNILGVSKEQGARWAKNLNLPARADTVFFAGCGYQYSAQLEVLMSMARATDKTVIGSELPMRFARFQKKLGLNLPGIYSNVLARGGDIEVKPLEAAVKVLRRMGLQPGYLAENEPCCGAPLNHAGFQDKFAENARQAYSKLNAAGVKQLVGMVPYCIHALKKLFPVYIDGYHIQVNHFIEVVAGKISLFKLKYPDKVRVTYHDPCQLVRFLNLVEEPRRILRSIENITLVETDWTRGAFSTCCGGGGGFESVFPALSEVLAVNRVTELLETKPDIIVTNCPGCIMQLQHGLKQTGQEGVKVLDLAEIVAAALE